MSWLWRAYPTPQESQPLSRQGLPLRGPLGPESGVAQLVGGPLEFPKGWSRARLYPEYSDTYTLQRAPTGWPFPESGAQGVVRVPMDVSGPTRGRGKWAGEWLFESGGKPQLNTSNPDCVGWCADPSARMEWGEAACQECEANWLTPDPPDPDCVYDCTGMMAPQTIEEWQSSGCNQCGQFPGTVSYGSDDPAPPVPELYTPDPTGGPTSSSTPGSATLAPAPVTAEGFDCDFCMDMWVPECDAAPCVEHLEAAGAEHDYFDWLKAELGLDSWDDWLEPDWLEPDVVPDETAPAGSKSKKAAGTKKRAATLPVGPALHAVDSAPSAFRPEYVAIGVGGLAVALGAWWFWSRKG